MLHDSATPEYGVFCKNLKLSKQFRFETESKAFFKFKVNNVPSSSILQISDQSYTLQNKFVRVDLSRIELR